MRYAFALYTKPETEEDFYYVTDRLRLRRYNEWLGEEEMAQEQFTIEDSEAVMQSLSLVKKVAADMAENEDIVWEKFRTNSQSQNLLLFASYPEEFSKVMQSGKRTSKEHRLITVFLLSRGQVQLDGGEWVEIANHLGWSDEDSAALSRSLIDKVLKFINIEANGGKEPEPFVDDEIEEGKPPSQPSKSGRGKRSRTDKTGTQSSGKSSPAESQTSDSTGETLAVNA